MGIDYQQFEIDLSRACVAAIDLLASKQSKELFYSVAIYADAFDGDFALYANTEADFKHTLNKYKSDWPDNYQDVKDVVGLKYNCGDWKYCSLYQPEELKECFDEHMEAWRDAIYDLSYVQETLTLDEMQFLQESACKVAISREFDEVLQKLNRTIDFMTLVTDHDEPSLAGLHRLNWYRLFNSLKGFEPVDYFAINSL